MLRYTCVKGHTTQGLRQGCIKALSGAASLLPRVLLIPLLLQQVELVDLPGPGLFALEPAQERSPQAQEDAAIARQQHPHRVAGAHQRISEGAFLLLLFLPLGLRKASSGLGWKRRSPRTAPGTGGGGCNIWPSSEAGAWRGPRNEIGQPAGESPGGGGRREGPPRQRPSLPALLKRHSCPAWRPAREETLEAEHLQQGGIGAARKVSRPLSAPPPMMSTQVWSCQSDPQIFAKLRGEPKFLRKSSAPLPMFL